MITKLSKNNSNKSNVVRVLPSFSNWLRRLDLSSSNPVEAYNRNFFRDMASKNSREALGVRNAFSYVRGFESKSDYETLNSSVRLQIMYHCITLII